MSPEHSPEPWKVHPYNVREIVLEGDPEQQVALIPGWSRTADDGLARRDKDRQRADAHRIVACVNALQGLNPEGVRPLLEAARDAHLAGYSRPHRVGCQCGGINEASGKSCGQTWGALKAALALLEGKE